MTPIISKLNVQALVEKEMKHSVNIGKTKDILKGALRLEDNLYPCKLKTVLGKKAPSELYYKGNLSLLNLSGVGFCGSRQVSEKGLETARDCVEQVATNSAVVISGYARGVDMVAHRVALRSGGSTIIVIPEGIEHFRIKKEIASDWDWSRVLVLSQCKPNDHWQVYHAMNRNLLIIGLSNAMVVIEAKEKGGTFEAGKSTLRFRMPLFVAEYEDMVRTPGNSSLLELGAYSLKKSRSEGRAKLTSLFEAIQNVDIKKNNNQSGQYNLMEN